MELETHFFENHSPSILTTVDFVAKRIASSCNKKIQSKGMAAVKNQFINIICEKFNEHRINKTVCHFNILFILLLTPNNLTNKIQMLLGIRVQN